MDKFILKSTKGTNLDKSGYGNKNIKKFNIENSAYKLDKYLENIASLNK